MAIVSIVLRIQKKEDNENPPHFIHEIKTIAYDVIGVNVFLRKLVRFLRKNPDQNMHTILLWCIPITSDLLETRAQHSFFIIDFYWLLYIQQYKNSVPNYNYKGKGKKKKSDTS